jgi:hypothetical protein
MTTDEKIVQVLEALQEGQKALQDVQQKQGEHLEAIQADVTVLRAGQKTLEAGQQALELKVETIHEYQKKAHTEIMDSLFESNEITGRAQKALEKRVARIEKHLGLPPVK